MITQEYVGKCPECGAEVKTTRDAYTTRDWDEQACVCGVTVEVHVKPVIDIRTVSRYWTCGVCNKRCNPQMVVAVFEKFTNTETGKEDLRVKHFQCLYHTENK